jgi:hypothetical protein
VVPTDSQHFNGQVKRMIGILKKCLESITLRKGAHWGAQHGDVRATQIVNSTQIAQSTGDPESGGLITPLHLMLGRASVEVPQVQFNEMPRLTRRLQFVEDAKKQFWKKWMQQVFRGSILSHKWTKEDRNVAVGDQVLLAEAKNDNPTYRMGIVENVKPGEKGPMQTVNV